MGRLIIGPEYTPAGETVQVIDIQPREGQSSVLARDVVVDRFGRHGGLVGFSHVMREAAVPAAAKREKLLFGRPWAGLPTAEDVDSAERIT